jgi:penicillin amidase
MLDIELDTRLGAYDFYRDLVLDAVSADEPEPTLAAARAAVTSWDGHANTASVGLPLLIRFRGTLRDDVIQGLLAACGMPGVSTGWLNDDEPLRRLLDARPKNLLPSEQQSWDSMIRADLRFSAERFMNDKGVRALDTPWGATNRAHIKNALTLAVRTLVPILDMPPDPLAGHPWCVRVMAPTFGASERLAVSPGHEDEAICEMPTGQCGHPLSRHYRDMQRAFLRGEPTPLLPGPPEHTLTLSPGASNGR